ncbi:MAG: hypothetical protein IAE79_17635 [Anaerolinea sp.]|nr:hypothetical protein [Anaerolinea sp.]
MLHRALEKLRDGTVADLTDAEAEAHRTYQRNLVAARREELRAQARERYRQRQEAMTEDERAAQRAKWREDNRRRAQRENCGKDLVQITVRPDHRRTRGQGMSLSDRELMG